MGEHQKQLRCAIYTRKSSEEGLEQDFNSLHAQREACEAFIKSQRHEGWVALPAHHDDGGYSGGTMDRPGLRQLLEDIHEKRVDVVVVYKVDRLTRSLADFAKIVEVFDAQHVSFVSVTQAFNTGQVARILENPVYVGEIAHKDETYRGQHEAIIDRATWDALQEKLAANSRNSTSVAHGQDPSLLAGLLVDADGHHFTCTHAV